MPTSNDFPDAFIPFIYTTYILKYWILPAISDNGWNWQSSTPDDHWCSSLSFTSRLWWVSKEHIYIS